jgi:TatD DNase family protein
MTISPFPLIDTHTHLCDSIFDHDRSDILKRARSTGIEKIISVSEDLADAKCNLDLAQQFPLIKPAAGLYPANLDLDKAQELCDFIRREQANLIAIGEVGLDYWIVKEASQREIQKHIFELFIKLAIELDLPLNVHSRSAGRHTVTMLLDKGVRKVQLHAFDGKSGFALPAVEAGYFFSIPPSVIRSRQKQKLVKQLPLSSILLETDSPVLGPVPNERNEPANITFAIEAVSEIKNLKKSEIIEKIYYNTTRLYGDLGI